MTCGDYLIERLTNNKETKLIIISSLEDSEGLKNLTDEYKNLNIEYILNGISYFYKKYKYSDGFADMIVCYSRKEFDPDTYANLLDVAFEMSNSADKTVSFIYSYELPENKRTSHTTNRQAKIETFKNCSEYSETTYLESTANIREVIDIITYNHELIDDYKKRSRLNKQININT